MTSTGKEGWPIEMDDKMLNDIFRENGRLAKIQGVFRVGIVFFLGNILKTKYEMHIEFALIVHV